MSFVNLLLVSSGVKAVQTPTQVQAAIVASNLIRWREGLAEKLGGWELFFAASVPGPVRELWAWEDLSSITHLAAAGDGGVAIITGGGINSVTPLASMRLPASMATTAGSPNVVVNDVGSNASTYESVTLLTPFSIGGICIYPGNYPIVSVQSADQYTINVGKPAVVTSSIGESCTIVSSVGSAAFTVNLVNHGLAIGDSFTIVLPTSVGGVVLSGFYTVAATPAPTANTFTIIGPNLATSDATVLYGTASTTFNLTAAAAFTTQYQGIAMPPNPGSVVPGMTVVDATRGLPLGTVQSYGPFNITITTNTSFSAGTTSLSMQTTSLGVVPGMTVYDASAGYRLLGHVASYIGTTLTLTAGALFHASGPNDQLIFSGGSGPFYDFSGAQDPPILVLTANNAINSAGASDVLRFSGGSTIQLIQWVVPNQQNAPTITASAAFTTAYSGIAMPPNPGWVAPNMTVNDVTANTVLGTVKSYGPTLPYFEEIPRQTNQAWAAGATTIKTVEASVGDVIPGMFMYDLTFTVGPPGTPLGRVVSYIGQTVTLAPPGAAWASSTSTDDVAFDSGTNSVLMLNALLPTNSFGASDLLGFPYGLSNPQPAGTTPVSAPDWCMENFGSVLLINPEDQPIFTFDPTLGLGNAQPIIAAPAKVHGMFVAMPQQMVVAYGASTQPTSIEPAVGGVLDPMLVAWCDAGNFNVWLAGADNQAGTYRLSRGSRIVGGLQGPLQCMLWTDVGLWLMQYIGFPDVWGFLEISRGCGLIAKKAVAVVGIQVYWMSRDGFWVYAGGGAVRLQCDVWDILKNNLNLNFLDNIRCAANTGFDEVSWECPSISSTSGENDIYVKYNVVTNDWDFGFRAVSEWIDQNIFGNPISAMPAPADSSGNAQSFIMQHEESADANGQPLQYMLRTGYFQLSSGEDFVFCDYAIPDFKWKRFAQGPSVSAQIQLTFFVNDWPDDDLNPPIAIGPITVTNRSDAVDIRCRGRYFSLQIAGNDLGSFMRLGGIKFRFAPDGRNPN